MNLEEARLLDATHDAEVVSGFSISAEGTLSLPGRSATLLVFE